ncbi:protamine P1 domain containing protein [Herbaspirillum sp.]|uniref:protamine P1 domain containing protein n=1 Tax=Herbaspirillum sp. TaxID=1890675 RepID=UPI001B153D28|nr:protamine P1 domain containing protein [Herbaspirillum sp.]MBO9537011.1 protamine P1 domain containing protein [Herbaspirillum sp.]
MSVSSVSSGNGSFYNTIVQPIKNVVKEVGDDIGDAYDTTVDTVKSAAATVGDDISAGLKKIGNIIDTSA